MTKQRVYTIIQVGSIDDIPSRVYDFCLIGAILLNLFIAIFDTFPQSEPYHDTIQFLEFFTVIYFTVDYLLRIWTSDLYFENLHLSPVKARLRYIFSFMGLINFLSCIPYFIPFGGSVFRMFRIVRILRIFRIHNYADPLNVIGNVIIKKKGQLLSSTFIVLIFMTAASLLMYTLEHEAQPEVFQNAFSGFWWAVTTLLTVGYGDTIPITLAGRICGIILTFLGVGMVAIPTGILSAGFVEQVAMLKQQKELEEIKHILTLSEANAQARHEENRQAIILSNGHTSIHTAPASETEPYHYCPYCGHKLPE